MIVIFATPIINFLIELNQQLQLPNSFSALENLMDKLESDAEKIKEILLVTDSFFIYLVNIFVMAIIPAVGEEFLFRGILQRLFKEWSKNIHFAVWFSAFLFSIMHTQFLLFIPIMILGALFGYLYFWSKNLWIPIIVHFLNNSIAITMVYLNGDIAKDVESIGTGGGSTLHVLISVLLVSVLIYSFYRISKEKNPKLGLSNSNNEQNE